MATVRVWSVVLNTFRLLIGGEDKRQITGVPIVSCANDIVGLQLIWQGKSKRCHPAKTNPKMFFTHSENHWSNGDTMRELFVDIIGPHIEAVKEELELSPVQHSIVLLDVWKHHYSKDFKNFIKEKFPRIELVYIPPGTTGEAQVCDLVVNKKMKELATKVTSEEVAHQVSRQLQEQQISGDNSLSIRVDIRLSALKPLVCKGMNASLEFFETNEGSALIAKGFEKAGITQCFDRDFQKEADAWFSQQGTEAAALRPDYIPEEPLIVNDNQDPLPL